MKKIYKSLGIGLLGAGLILGCRDKSDSGDSGISIYTSGDIPKITIDINRLADQGLLNYTDEERLEKALIRERELREQGYEIFRSFLVGWRIGEDISPKDNTEFDYEAVNRGFYDDGFTVNDNIQHVIVYRRPKKSI